jgi:hypothetical protein
VNQGRSFEDLSKGGGPAPTWALSACPNPDLALRVGQLYLAQRSCLKRRRRSGPSMRAAYTRLRSLGWKSPGASGARPTPRRSIARSSARRPPSPPRRERLVALGSSAEHAASRILPESSRPPRTRAGPPASPKSCSSVMDSSGFLRYALEKLHFIDLRFVGLRHRASPGPLPARPARGLLGEPGCRRLHLRPMHPGAAAVAGRLSASGPSGIRS